MEKVREHERNQQNIARARGIVKNVRETNIAEAGETVRSVEKLLKRKSRQAKTALTVQQTRDPIGPYRPEGPMGPIDYQMMTNALDPLPTGPSEQTLKVLAKQEHSIGGIGRVSRYQREPTMNPTNSVPLSCGAVGGCGWD